MTKKTTSLLLAFILLISSISAFLFCLLKIDLFESRKDTLNNYSILLNDETGYGNNVITSWLKNSQGKNGIPFYDKYDEEHLPTPSDKVVRSVKDSFYVISLIANYAVFEFPEMEDFSDHFRGMLDHILQLKETKIEFLDDCKEKKTTDQEIMDFYFLGKKLYDKLCESLDDMFSTEKETGTHFIFSNLRAELKQNSMYLKTHYDVSKNLYGQYVNVIEFVLKTLNLEKEEYKTAKQSMLDTLDRYINSTQINSFPNENILGFTEEDIQDFDSLPNETKQLYADNSMIAVFNMKTLHNYFVSKYEYSTDIAKVLDNNDGPLLYKLLDYIESLKDGGDKPNMCLLGLEVVDDSNFLYGFIKGEYTTVPTQQAYQTYVTSLRQSRDEYYENNIKIPVAIIISALVMLISLILIVVLIIKIPKRKTQKTDAKNNLK